MASLAERTFDLAVIGGGVFGICAAWDAASRGLSVCLLERGDFAHATSANSFKIVHGGIRYLQHGDLVRVRESCRERRALLRLAPHLVHPLPIVVPTYRRWPPERALLRAGGLVYDLLSLDRNRGIEDPERRIPAVRSLSVRACRERFPGLLPERLTGAIEFCDAQMYNPPRLAMAFLRSAVAAGAVVCNYVEAGAPVLRDGRVMGVEAWDRLGMERFEVRAKAVLNATGAWAPRWLAQHVGVRLAPSPVFSRDSAFVVRKKLPGPWGLAVPGRTRDPDAVFSRGARHLFLVPWRDYTLVGVWHRVHSGDPDRVELRAEELEEFVGEVNEACPGLGLVMDDILMTNFGLVLFAENPPDARDLRYGKRSRIVDHGVAHGIAGLWTLVGIRWTTARRDAQRAVDRIAARWGRRLPRSATGDGVVHGGMQSFSSFATSVQSQRPAAMAPELFQALLRNYGSDFTEVLALGAEDPSWLQPLGRSTVLRAEVIHAVRSEMAVKLADVVCRRTDLGTGEYPGEAALGTCAQLMARELGWDARRMEAEIEEVRRLYPAAFRRAASAAGAGREAGLP